MEFITVEVENQEADFIEKMESLPVTVDKKKPVGFLVEIKKANSAKSYASEHFNSKGEKHISISTTKVPKDKKGTHVLVWRKK